MWSGKRELAEIQFLAKPIQNWTQPKVYSLYPDYLEPDIWEIHGKGAFAVTPEAAMTLDMFLEMAGEQLPLPYQGKELIICNILQCLNCVDEEHSEWRLRKGERIRLLKPAFFPQCMEASTLFKIPQLRENIYCWEKAEDPESEFRACVLENNLKGLRFELVWEGDERLY